MTTDPHEEMVRAIVDLVSELASLFEGARVEGPTPEPFAGMRVELSCSAPGTARVVLYPSDDDVDVHMGEDTWIELLKGRKSMSARVAEVRKILEAVVNGRYEETLWRWRGKKIKSKAVLYNEHGKAFAKPRGWHGLPSLAPDPRAKRTHIVYQPYS
jgi:hypothetical protein